MFSIDVFFHLNNYSKKIQFTTLYRYNFSNYITKLIAFFIGNGNKYKLYLSNVNLWRQFLYVCSIMNEMRERTTFCKLFVLPWNEYFRFHHPVKLYTFLVSRLYTFLVSRLYTFLVSKHYTFIVSKLFTFLVSKLYTFLVSKLYIFLVSRLYKFLVSRPYTFLVSKFYTFLVSKR